MSKAVTLNPELIAKKFPAARLERQVRNRPKLRYYLIICEGAKTEPNYFESLRKRLPPKMVTRVDIQGTGTNTLTLLARAKEEIEKRYKSGHPPYYNVWLVFDKDSFPDDDFDNTIKTAKSRTKETKCYWHCAWSNEAFELWYLLHFHSHSVALSRAKFSEKLEEELKGLGVDRKYQKNATDMYILLEALQEQAIAHAKTMFKNQKENNIPPSKMNPATTVHLLVEELIKYIVPQK